jgi:hypothetical protein
MANRARVRKPQPRGSARATTKKPPPSARSQPVAEPTQAAQRQDRRPTARELVDIAIAVACAGYVFWQLQPARLFADTTPTISDLGGHVWGPSFLRSHLLGHGLFAAWSNDWFGGFPAHRFYMPLPAFGAVALSAVVPYGVALKLMVALPLVAAPLVAWRFGRAARMPAPGPSLMALASLFVLFDSSNLKYGGSISATVSGEYGNALALVFGLWCLGLFVADLEKQRRGPAAGVLGAVAALCHPVGLAFVMVGLIAMVGAWATLDLERAITQLAHLGRTVLLVLLLSAFWYLPFVSFRLYTNDLNFVRVAGLRLLFPLAPVVEVLLAALVVIGVLDAYLEGRAAVVGLAITGILFAIAALVIPRGLLWNARLAPVWYVARALLAGAGAYSVIEWIRRRVAAHSPDWTWLAVPGVLAVIVFGVITWDTGRLPGTTKTTVTVDDRVVTTKVQWLIGPSHRPSTVPLFVSTAFDGYERDVHWTEYQQLINTMRSLSGKYGCGRVMPEFDPSGRYGSFYADNLLPYWTDGCVSTVTGLYYDSSPTSAFALVAESALSKTPSFYEPGLPYEQLSLARGVKYLHELGARYYIAVSPEAIAQARSTAGLREVATVGTSVVFVVDDVNIVDPLTTQPVVVAGVGDDRGHWERVALQWFSYAEPGFTRIAASGPPAWSRLSGAAAPPTDKLEQNPVSDVHVDDRRIAFHVAQSGLPILVRVSYFPWWRVQGAHGPYRVAPNWMVVVPTGNDVALTQQTKPIEWIGNLLTLVGVILAIGLALWARGWYPRRQRSTSEAAAA